MKSEHFDVIISGSAMTGASLALCLSSLSNHRLRIALVEKSAPNPLAHDGFNARVIALSKGSMQKYQRITTASGHNLGEKIKKIATAISTIMISDQGHCAKSSLRASDIGIDHLGMVVSLDDMGVILLDEIKKSPNITMFCPNRITKEHYQPKMVQLWLDGGEILTASLLVAADGTHSPVACNAHIKAQAVKDFNQHALIANINTEYDHQGYAFERFTRQGPLALLPMGEKMMSIVWCQHDPHKLMKMSDAEFINALQDNFGWHLGSIRAVSKRLVFPLIAHQAPRHINHRLALVGNAAQLLHPVAGQGFNIAMRDLFCLAKLISRAFTEQRDIGSYQILSDYQRIRQGDQCKMLSFTSLLVDLFSNDSQALSLIRSIGLQILHKSPWLKRSFATIPLGW